MTVGPGFAEFSQGTRVQSERIAPTTFRYVFAELFGVRLWIPEGWSHDDVSREVFSNYRPPAMRELETRDF